MMQFLPQNPTKFLVTSADSHVRIVDGALNVIEKYKGIYLIFVFCGYKLCIDSRITCFVLLNS